jgi:hypothetical protein
LRTSGDPGHERLRTQQARATPRPRRRANWSTCFRTSLRSPPAMERAATVTNNHVPRCSFRNLPFHDARICREVAGRRAGDVFRGIDRTRNGEEGGRLVYKLLGGARRVRGEFDMWVPPNLCPAKVFQNKTPRCPRVSECSLGASPGSVASSSPDISCLVSDKRCARSRFCRSLLSERPMVIVTSRKNLFELPLSPQQILRCGMDILKRSSRSPRDPLDSPKRPRHRHLSQGGGCAARRICGSEAMSERPAGCGALRVGAWPRSFVSIM